MKNKWVQKNLSISLPFPPSVNHIYNHTRNGTYLKKEVKTYRKEVLVLLHGRKRAQFGNDRLRVTLFIFPPDERKRDLDNLGKVILDSLEENEVYENDSQIDVLNFIRCWKEKPGRVNVTIRNIKPSHLLKTKPFDGKRGK
jgi:crossover junction endodeoxyribonuclease RusA